MSYQFSCKNCNNAINITKPLQRCPLCNEPLGLKSIDNGIIDTKAPINAPFWQRYRDFYPYIATHRDISLGEGFTPLTSIPQLARALGIKAFYAKNETLNPTWSFKDRGTAIGTLHALQLGYTAIGTVSTGNMAASVAAYGAKAGLKTYILVKGDMASEKVNPIAIYGAHLVRVHGDYSKLYNESLRIGEENNIYFINSDAPMRVEGSKSIAFEICEQLNFNVPDYVIIPTSAGGNFRGIMKGFLEFYKAGLIKHLPIPVCAQSAGCAPIASAWSNKRDRIQHFGSTNTIAHGIENPYPPSGNVVLNLLREFNGIALTVTNDEIINAQQQLASYGIFGQPASAVPLAAATKLSKQNILTKDSSIASIITGSGLKYTTAFNYHNLQTEETTVENLADYFKGMSLK